VLGYEDLNDHEDLCRDPLLAALVGKSDPTGQERRREGDRGQPLASKATLNRLEWGVAVDAETDRYRRIALDPDRAEGVFVEAFLEAHEEPPEEIVLDCDATDDPVHGHQEGRFFHGYYGHYCYLPLYIFCGTHLLCAKLRRADQDGSAGCVEELERIIGQIREAWPEVRIVVRGDSGFAREELMCWCEDNGVDFVLGLARNPRLEKALEPAFERAEELCGESGEPERVFDDFSYQTRKSWSRERRVVGKAEITHRGPNPRFVVTSLTAEDASAAELYTERCCARGEMENRIKEQQLCLFADRTSAQKMVVNQIRLGLSSLAYTLFNELRRLALEGTSYARARCDTIRLHLWIGVMSWTNLDGSGPLRGASPALLDFSQEDNPSVGIQLCLGFQDGLDMSDPRARQGFSSQYDFYCYREAEKGTWYTSTTEVTARPTLAGGGEALPARLNNDFVRNTALVRTSYGTHGEIWSASYNVSTKWCSDASNRALLNYSSEDECALARNFCGQSRVCCAGGGGERLWPRGRPCARHGVALRRRLSGCPVVPDALHGLSVE